MKSVRIVLTISHIIILKIKQKVVTLMQPQRPTHKTVQSQETKYLSQRMWAHD